MREKLEKLIGVKAASKRDEDIVKNMTALIREKDAMIDRLRAEISSLVVSVIMILMDLYSQERKNLKTLSEIMSLSIKKESKELNSRRNNQRRAKLNLEDQ